MSKKVKTPSALPTLAEQAENLSSSIEQSKVKEPRYYGAACTDVSLPSKWMAKANETISVANPIGLAKAIARYEALKQNEGATFYREMQDGRTVQDWANVLQQLGVWGATKQLVAGGAQHPCMFLNAALRNKWVTLKAA